VGYVSGVVVLVPDVSVVNGITVATGSTASNITPAALWVGIVLVVFAILVFTKGVSRVVVIIVAAVIVYALKANGLL
jgi:hypothetical protein